MHEGGMQGTAIAVSIIAPQCFPADTRTIGLAHNTTAMEGATRPFSQNKDWLFNERERYEVPGRCGRDCRQCNDFHASSARMAQRL